MGRVEHDAINLLPPLLLSYLFCADNYQPAHPRYYYDSRIPSCLLIHPFDFDYFHLLYLFFLFGFALHIWLSHGILIRTDVRLFGLYDCLVLTRSPPEHWFNGSIF